MQNGRLLKCVLELAAYSKSRAMYKRPDLCANLRLIVLKMSWEFSLETISTFSSESRGCAAVRCTLALVSELSKESKAVLPEFCRVGRASAWVAFGVDEVAAACKYNSY